MFDNNGTVFNVGSQTWVRALLPEILDGAPTVVGIITRNLLSSQRPGLAAAKTTRQAATAAVFEHHFAQANGGYRFFYSVDPFYSVPGWTYDGEVFLALLTQQSNSVPLYQYRQVRTDGPSDYYSTSATVHLAGWGLDGVVFYVYPSAQLDTAPVYQYHSLQPDGSRKYYYSTNPAMTAGWTMDGVAYYVPASR